MVRRVVVQKEPYAVIPCARCGYDAPRAVGPRDAACPLCAAAPPRGPASGALLGPWTGILAGFLALFVGLRLLFSTPRLLRWLGPPLLLTGAIFVGVLVWLYRKVNAFAERLLPGEIRLSREGLQELSERWDWLKATWASVVAAAEWTLNQGWLLLTSEPLRVLGWFLIGSVVAWYCFSIAYEAIAGPFLDEMQARIEARWFGGDPRSRLERPNDIPERRCVQLGLLGAFTIGAAGVALVAFAGLGLLPALFVAPLAGAPVLLVDRRFGPWLLWVARVEARATWASLKAALLTGVLLLLALPLYFVPGIGYFLFALVCGFATACGLLDIPFERRGWSFTQRARFLGRNAVPLLAFGACAGFLLSIPVIGIVLMVPAASMGGMWLVCRLDKGFLRSDG